jgi:hypothetical protein
VGLRFIFAIGIFFSINSAFADKFCSTSSGTCKIVERINGGKADLDPNAACACNCKGGRIASGIAVQVPPKRCIQAALECPYRMSSDVGSYGCSCDRNLNVQGTIVIPESAPYLLSKCDIQKTYVIPAPQRPSGNTSNSGGSSASSPADSK